MTLDEITEQMRTKVEAWFPVKDVVMFDFGDEGVVRIDGSVSPPLVDNERTEAVCIISFSTKTLESIAAGKTKVQMAFLLGKIKVKGSMGTAMQLVDLLE